MKQKSIWLFALLCIGLLEPLQALADLKLGVFPRRSVEVTQKAFQPLADHMSAVLGENVQLIVPANFKTFWQGVEKKEYDIVHYNQFHYTKSNKEFGYRVIAANEEFGKREISGALIVRVDSGINSLKDIKGKTIVFGGGKKAMGSYLAPTDILQHAGLREGRDYTAKFAKNPPSAVIDVYNKKADVAGSGNVILQIGGVKKRIDTSKLKILVQSEPFVHLPWAVKDSFPADKAEKLQSMMIGLKDVEKGKEVLKAAKVTGFQAVSDADFAKVREIAGRTLLQSSQFATN
jgi:phosphonate transport system substrate-binding protein